MTHALDAAWLDAMLDAEQHDDALDQLNAALDATPDNAGLYALRGDFWAAAWDHRGAADDWETALSLDPSLAEVQLKLALLEITRPYRLTADAEDNGPAGEHEAWPEDEAEEAGEARLKRMLQDALEAELGSAAPQSDDDEYVETEWFGDDDDRDYFEFQDEDSIRAQGLLRLQALADAGRLNEAQLLHVVNALSETAWMPWHALDLVQRGLTANPYSLALLRARVRLWMGLATDTGEVSDEVPVGYSADLTGNLYHPVSAATALQHGNALPPEAWDAGLYERRAHIYRLLGDHAAAAEDFNLAAQQVESLAGTLAGEEEIAARTRLQQLQDEAAVSRGGDRALIAARQRQMQDTLDKLAELQQSLGVASNEDETASLEDARDAAHEYIDTIGNDPLEDSDYVGEVCEQMPQIAEAILKTLENEPYEFQGLSERELYDRVGEEDARLYVAERAAFVRQGFAAVGWVELQALSRRLGKPAVLDLLLSPDQTTVGLCFVLGGIPAREIHTLFADGSSLSHATIRGRSAGWAPAPFQQVHLPPETPLDLVLRVHQSAVSQRTAMTGEQPVLMHPSQLPDQLDQLRHNRYEARLAQGFHDAEIRGYSREHYRAGGQTLREALAARMARLRPRTH